MAVKRRPNDNSIYEKDAARRFGWMIIYLKQKTIKSTKDQVSVPSALKTKVSEIIQWNLSKTDTP